MLSNVAGCKNAMHIFIKIETNASREMQQLIFMLNIRIKVKNHIKTNNDALQWLRT